MTIKASVIIGLGIIALIFYITGHIFNYLEREHDKEEKRRELEEYKIKTSESKEVEEALKEWDR